MEVFNYQNTVKKIRLLSPKKKKGKRISSLQCKRKKRLNNQCLNCIKQKQLNKLFLLRNVGCMLLQNGCVNICYLKPYSFCSKKICLHIKMHFPYFIFSAFYCKTIIKEGSPSNPASRQPQRLTSCFWEAHKQDRKASFSPAALPLQLIFIHLSQLGTSQNHIVGGAQWTQGRLSIRTLGPTLLVAMAQELQRRHRGAARRPHVSTSDVAPMQHCECVDCALRYVNQYSHLPWKTAD